VKEVTRSGVRFADGKEEQFDAIILATGYRSNVPSWLKVKFTSLRPATTPPPPS
jgi:lysine/ornithine N-monooxygenase